MYLSSSDTLIFLGAVPFVVSVSVVSPRAARAFGGGFCSVAALSRVRDACWTMLSHESKNGCLWPAWINVSGRCSTYVAHSSAAFPPPL
eukprot:scaffold326017_cov84-Tisochrysis_lutea.AAC.1